MKVGLQLQVTVIVMITLAIKILDRVMYDVNNGHNYTST